MPVLAIDLATIADFGLGSLRVRPSLREAVGGGETHILEPRVMQVLALLAQQRGQTVSRDLLVEKCWGGVIVGEDSIQRCIGRLRKLADATQAFEIITLSRIGYRLNEADVRAEPMGKQPERLLAVLPFDNLSNDPGYDYVADGVSEEILQSIGRHSSIKVIGRTSSFQYRGADKVIARIAEELGATHLLDGSVRRAGERLRVSAQLTDLGDQTMIWSERFDGDAADPFDLQDRVATATVAALNGVFEIRKAIQPLTGQAYEAFLQLRNAMHEFSPGGIGGTPARELVAQVERLCPDNADALGLIAAARAVQRWRSSVADEAEFRAGAVAAAEQALAIDPNCGSAHLALVMLDIPSGDPIASEVKLTRALAAAPNDSQLLYARFIHLNNVGRSRDAARVVEDAYRIDPLRPNTTLGYALALYGAGQRRKAFALMQYALQQWPSAPMLFAIVLWTAAIEGEHDFARTLMASNWQERFSPEWLDMMKPGIGLTKGILESAPDMADRMRRALDRSIAAGNPNLVAALMLAWLDCDLDELYDRLDHASFDAFRLPSARLGPLEDFALLFLKPLSRFRQSPRFVHLCARLGLVAYWKETGHWPDCVSEVAHSYDFKAEALKLA